MRGRFDEEVHGVDDVVPGIEGVCEPGEDARQCSARTHFKFIRHVGRFSQVRRPTELFV